MSIINRKLLTGSLTFLVCCLAHSAWAEAPLSTNYYPLEVGNQWTNKVTANGHKQKIVTRVTGFDTSDGENVARIEAIKYGNVAGVEYMSQNEKGVFRHWIFGKKVSPPVQLLRYPIKDGDSWENETIIDGIKINSTSKIKVEEVKESGETYKIVVSEFSAKYGPLSLWCKSWYFPEVGIIKQLLTMGPVTVELQLEKFDAAKK